MVNTINTLTERNKELLAKIEELEKGKNVEIKKYEYSLKRSLIKRTPEEHLIRENEILSKIVLETLLRFSKKQFSGSQKTDEEINELLSQPNWREKAQFEVGDYKCKEEGEVSECIGHFISCPWLISAREPIEIIENLKNEKTKKEQDQEMLIDAYCSLIDEQEVKIKELEKNNKWLQKELKEAWSEGETHIEAMHYAGELAKAEMNNYKDEVKDLKEEVRDNQEIIQKSRLIIRNQENEIRQLKEESQDSLGLLAKAKKTIQTQETLLDLANKPLPPLPKKQNKFKLIGTKVKNKFSRVAERVKSQTREMVAQIEVRVK